MYSNQRKNNPMLLTGKTATTAAVIIFIMTIVAMIVGIAVGVS